MKEIFNFICWQWRKWELWQRLFILSSFFFGAGVVADEPLRFYLLLVPVTVVFCSTFKWFIWDIAKESWNTYKQEKSSLLEIIKTSDQK